MSYITVKEFADQMGISAQAVNKAIEQGRLVRCIKTSRGRRVLDANLAVQEWQSSLQRPTRSKMSFSGVDTPSQQDGNDLTQNVKKSIAVQQLFKARLTQLEFEKRSKKLVNAESVNKEFFALSRTLRDNLLNIPDRISAEISGLSNPNEIHKRLTKELTMCLNDMEKAFEKSKTLTVE